MLHKSKNKQILKWENIGKGLISLIYKELPQILLIRTENDSKGERMGKRYEETVKGYGGIKWDCEHVKRCSVTL